MLAGATTLAWHRIRQLGREQDARVHEGHADGLGPERAACVEHRTGYRGLAQRVEDRPGLRHGLVGGEDQRELHDDGIGPGVGADDRVDVEQIGDDRRHVWVYPGAGGAAGHRPDPVPGGEEATDDGSTLGARSTVNDDC